MIGYSIRSIRTLAIAAAVAAVGACSTSNGSPTSPSVAANTANSGGQVRDYKAVIAPTSVGAGSTGNSFTLAITNCNTAECDALSATSANQKIRSITIQVQPGFTITSGPTAPSTWNVSLVSGVIKLDVKTGNDGLAGGDSVTVSFEASAPCAVGATDVWTTAAYQDDEYVTTTPYSLFGTQPRVTVTGTCAGQCTYGQGFWKNHSPDNPGHQTNLWPVTSLSLGTVNYTAAELVTIFDEPVAGNGLIDLAHQLIAAKLNLANGADGSAINASIAAADALIGGLVVPPVGGGSLSPVSVSALVTALKNYNEGITGPGHCSDEVLPVG